MSYDNDGGPASPCYDPDQNAVIDTGITKRDFFAAQAMQGTMSCLGKQRASSETKQEMAEEAYQVADAMLEQREKAS